jgi:hypothetical protein
MTDDISIDRSSHLAAIVEAIHELEQMHDLTAAPAPECNQLIGTVVDNTMGLLAAPASALNGGHWSLEYSADRNWLSLMQAVHRSFFSSIHLALEAGMSRECARRGITVSIARQAQIEAEIQALQNVAPESKQFTDSLTRLRNALGVWKPTFDDYLNSCLACSTLRKADRTAWRKFFRALTIVRNKSSHSDPSLSPSEVVSLRDGGLGVMVSDDDTLVMNPRMYVQVVSAMLKFCELVIVPLNSTGQCDAKESSSGG